MTMLATVWPGTMLRFDAVGRATPDGQTVTKLAALGFVTVTFNATAPTPAAGTPPRPRINRLSLPASPIAPPPAARPSTVGDPGRVSMRRAGVSPVNALPVGNQPSTSTMTSVPPLL